VFYIPLTPFTCQCRRCKSNTYKRFNLKLYADNSIGQSQREKRGSQDISTFVRADHWFYVRYVVSFNFLFLLF
jgi:hypothetical protein